MQLAQLVRGRVEALRDAILVEETRQFLALTGFVLAFPHPRRLVQHQRFQLFVLFKLAYHRAFAVVFLFPQFDGALYCGNLFEHVVGQAVYVERGCYGYGIAFVGTTHIRQSLYHHPSGVVGVFDGEAIVGPVHGEKLAQVDVQLAWAMLCKGLRVGGKFGIAQQGQVVLFSVAKSLARYRYATYPNFYAGSVELGAFLQVEQKANVRGLAGIHRAGLRVGIEYLVCFGVYNLNQCRSRQRLFRGVDYAGSYPTLVAQSHKAGHVGLYHHLLGGHGLVFHQHVVHFLVGGQAHKAPCGDTFGQRKLNGNVAIGIRSEGWIEEGRLVQVLSNGRFFAIISYYLLISIISIAFVLASLHNFKSFVFHTIVCHRG